MIYELRVYRALPGRMPALMKRFEDHTVSIFSRLGFRQIGYWQNLVGPSHLDLTYILVWESLDEFQRLWERFESDPEWLKASATSEKDGPLIEKITNTFLTPTAFSALQ